VDRTEAGTAVNGLAIEMDADAPADLLNLDSDALPRLFQVFRNHVEATCDP
jgi:hypothetical protein